MWGVNSVSLCFEDSPAELEHSYSAATFRDAYPVAVCLHLGLLLCCILLMISRSAHDVNLTVPAMVSMNMLTSLGLRMWSRHIADEKLPRTTYARRVVVMAILSSAGYTCAQVVWPRTSCEAIPFFVSCDALLHLTVSVHRRFASISLMARLLLLIMEGLSHVLHDRHEQAGGFIGALRSPGHHPSSASQPRLTCLDPYPSKLNTTT